MIRLTAEPAVIQVGVRTPAALRLTNRAAGELSQIRLSFRLPEGLELLRGQTSLTVQRLPPGETAQVPLVIQARRAGQQPVQQLNLSFRDWQGRIHRYEGEPPAWVAQVAEPAPPPPPPPPAPLELSWTWSALCLETWSLGEIVVSNPGPGVARRVRISSADPRAEVQPAEPEHLSASFRTAPGRAPGQPGTEAGLPAEPEDLLPGQEARLRLNLKPLEMGELSLAWRVRYELADGSVQERLFRMVVRVEKPKQPPASVTQISQVWQISGDVGLIKQTGTQPMPGGEPSQPTRCPSCGRPAPPSQRFCEQCGARLG